MNLNIGDTLNGFLLVNTEKIEDIKSVGYLFEHKKSGARLMFLENDDDNKVFFISFKTPPEDDCGTPHIIEHSVLCGSTKYPVKDPFNEMAKGSLNTYLNALTYSDKTVYPIASRNTKDFKNLMDVYLDAVFNPLILKHREIFMQEGYHLHMEDISNPLEIKGVVYNEMKGAFSDPDRYMDGAINTALFPNSPYRFESGGDPDKIPELTYEKFIEFYKKNYHPSNSFIYLFGNVDIEERLKYLDMEYLSHFERQLFDNEIHHQKSLNAVIRKEDFYPIVEKKENEAMYAAGFITGSSYDEEKSLGYSILSYILMDTNASPVRKVLTESGFCSEADGWFDSSILDTVFTIAAKGAKENAADEFENIVMNELKSLVKSGIDKELIDSAVNAFEFMLSEENFGYKPRGLYYGLKMMNSWLHKDNPFDSFRYKKHINGIRLKSRGGYFEKLISDGMVNNNTKVFVSLQPKEGMQEKLDEEERKELEQYKNSLSLTEKEKIVNETKNLLLFQAQPEDLSVVPSLNLSDIDKKAENIENELMDGIFYVPGDTNGVIYAELSFNLDGISEENYHYLGLLCELIGKLDTEKYGFNEIPTKIDLYTGGISSSCSAYFGTDGNIKRALNIGIKALSRNVNELFDIVEQTVNKMLFDKQDSIKLIIKDRISKLESHLTQNGHMTAVNRALSYSNPAYKFKDETSGIGYLKFLYSLDKNFKDDDIKKIRALAIEVLSQGRLTVGISCDECDFNMAKGIKNIIYERKQSSEEHIYLKSDMVSEGIITSGKIQYVAKSSDYKKVGYNYSGKLLVLKNIIDLEYLWNTVRVQGGAYGCGCNFLRSGSMYMYSYRDPNLKKTLETFNAASEFISNFNADEEAMASYIIGAVNSLDRPLNKEQRLKTALIRHIAGISSEMHQKERDEVLSCTSEDIRAYAPMLKTMADSPYICVIGNGDNIKNDKELFDDIITLK